MSPRIRFQLIGGFLGAGKTTTVARLARWHQARGRTVGVVTNDQAADLVDSATLREQGLNVGEVAGACFCCRFEELTETLGSLGRDGQPDVILAEPVGSCTDLVSTVLRPLARLHGTRFDIAPYAVILKPSHGRKILRGEAGSGFSPKAAYILRKQLEEADLVLLNRLDELTPDETEELERLVAEAVPGTPTLRISARTGEGFNTLAAALEGTGEFGGRLLDVDYDLYAEGEAELGWHNGRAELRAETPFPLDDCLLELLRELQEGLRIAGMEPAHVKVIGLMEGGFALANLIAADHPAELSVKSGMVSDRAEWIINARVAGDPAELAAAVRTAVETVCRRRRIRAEFPPASSFRPGRPVPTHRDPPRE